MVLFSKFWQILLANTTVHLLFKLLLNKHVLRTQSLLKGGAF